MEDEPLEETWTASKQIAVKTEKIIMTTFA
jgi:hypothetical protein